MTKVASGWIPSATRPTDDMREDHSDDECTEQQLEQAERVPLSSQQEVDDEAARWATEWAVQEPWTPIPWPSISGCIDDLPALSVSILREAALTFAANTGLGWDRLQPRAVLRCPDKALIVLACILVAAEAAGCWPESVGVTLIYLVPKPGGGRRPIGLLPSIIRW